jgi:DNA helicase HerA-like ATPase
MTLFSWIKKNPARGRALQGLLVIDEARDFVPALRSVPGKDNLIRLVAQPRKYGLGIIFATQAPKSIDHNIIANCSTRFYGRQNSPAAVDTVKDQLTQRGASGNDVAKLPRGVFYAFTEGLTAPVKIQTPLCLSHHPSSPPDEAEVLGKAERSRGLV